MTALDILIPALAGVGLFHIAQFLRRAFVAWRGDPARVYHRQRRAIRRAR